jgi:phage terminase large subunit-like protein
MKLHPADVYCRDVISGKIVASRLVRLACKRHLRDLETGKQRGLYFDSEAGQHAVEFFSFLKHSKGEWAGQSFELSPWEIFIVYVLFGWKKKGGLRRFSAGYAEVARKNGKSTLCAGIGLYLFFADGEPGAEVYCAATKKDQARIVFKEAERMRKASPALSKRIVSFRDNMNIPGTASKFEPLGADEDTLDGLNIHGAIIDEYHAHKTAKVFDVIDTATAARRQPLTFTITTAGFDRESPCWKQHAYCERVLEEIVPDDSIFIFIAGLDKDDDWEDERNWHKANPNLLVSVKIDDLRRKAHKAKNEPSSLNTFLRLHLNKWTNQDTAWIRMEKWNACVGYPLAGIDAKVLHDQMLERLAGRLCIIGLDLSSKVDLTAAVKLFPPIEEDPHWIVIPRFFMPADNVDKRVKEDRVPYDVWIREGFITATDGNVVDFDFIRATVLKDCDAFDVREVAFDPWNATQLSTQLIDDGVTMVEHRQGYASMSEPTKNLGALVLSKKLAHLGNPVLKWMASNIVIKTDEAGNIKPNKNKSGEKIDGLVALIMALGRAAALGDGGASAYTEDRGVFTV